MLKLIVNYLTVSVSERYKKEFEANINRMNLSRGRITAITFIILEIIMLFSSFAVKGRDFFRRPGIFYGYMYIIMILIMTLFLVAASKLRKDIPKNGSSITAVGIIFTVATLSWCAGISLLDQMSYGQIIVYVVATIAVAVAPLFKPLVFLMIYLPVHIVFLTLMPYFQGFRGDLFGNYVNSTTILIISWVISCMRYKSQVEDFNNRKIIQEKKDELVRVNRELEEANRRLEILSRTDSLTDIFNRSVFDKSIKTEWDRCKRHFDPLSLIMIDIDFFKAYNDNYGHQAGDECLRQIAGVLSDCARRASDIVTRYGGEEFAVIVPDTDKENAYELARKMRKAVEELNIPHEYSAITDRVTISLGIYTATPSDKLSIEEFIGIADRALYEAKKENRNIIVVA